MARVSLPPLTRPAKSADVAALAGVSRATVSHILNGQGDRFPEQTRERVRAAAAQLEYRPSPAARNLVRGHSDTIVLLAPNSTWGSNLQDAVDQVVADTRQLGARNVLVRFASGDIAASVEALLQLKPLAVVDLGFLPRSGRQRLASAGIITVPRFTAPQESTAALGLAIAQLQVAVLVEGGASRIWFAALGDDRFDAYNPERFESLSIACRAHRLPAPQVVRIPLDIEGSTEALASLATDVKPGLACFNDDVAIAVLAGARRRGIRVPDDLMVIGMDHTRQGQLWDPRLTTIEFDMRGYMDSAIDELMALLSDNESESAPYDERLISLVRGESA
jgi:DNA-binding LacI/PurR family transcriptional regulator